MLISSKGMYGLRAVFEIAQFDQSEPIPVSKIAEATKLSQNYLEQLLGKLAKGGILKVRRGINGGYNLASKPKEISIGKIITLLEGKLRIANKDSCHVLNLFLDDVATSIYQKLDAMTLDDFNHYKERFESSLHFSI